MSAMAVSTRALVGVGHGRKQRQADDTLADFLGVREIAGFEAVVFTVIRIQVYRAVVQPGADVAFLHFGHEGIAVKTGSLGFTNTV